MIWTTSSSGTTGSPVTSTYDGRRRDFWLRALIVGGAILVWLAIIGALVSVAFGVWLGVDLGGSSSRYTDERGNTCDLDETSAVPALLCPESITP